MKKILLSGCNGRMGKAISAAVSERNDCKIVAGYDINTNAAFDYPVFSDFHAFDGEVDCILDFSHPSVLTGLLDYAQKRKIPAVIATTGLSPEQIEELMQAGMNIPIFFSANMSLGINLLVELAKKAAAVLGDNYDIEIIEKHHNQKVDAPSGTALLLADAINHVQNDRYDYVYDRHNQRKKREKREIGIHAIRGGTIVGEHEILFAGRDEIISLSHSATSKEVFATGAINAAIFITDKAPGVYNMSDLLA